jgi:hypothetical protein
MRDENITKQNISGDDIKFMWSKIDKTFRKIDLLIIPSVVVQIKYHKQVQGND